jgi:hypothetical protein
VEPGISPNLDIGNKTVYQLQKNALDKVEKRANKEGGVQFLL